MLMICIEQRLSSFLLILDRYTKGKHIAMIQLVIAYDYFMKSMALLQMFEKLQYMNEFFSNVRVHNYIQPYIQPFLKNRGGGW